jgi:hypothetical protein
MAFIFRVLLADYFIPVSCLPSCLTWKTKTTCSVDRFSTKLTRRFIPENRTVRKSGFPDFTAMLPQLRAEQRLTDKPHRTRLTSFYIFPSWYPSLSERFGGLQTP